ncbi:hypothetical protein EDC04DRAFT_2600846 [Pisolithus marmoratus]|nr:hypothetical protein EDC04DRAFT_2600846 [Pisolithus marmoratus]
MDGENVQYHQRDVVAGPSTMMQGAPVMFLPPPPGTLTTTGAKAYSQPETSLASTQDLLARFHLHAAYNNHVHPHTPTSVQLSAPPSSAISPNAIPHDHPPENDEKKKKNSYRHLIKNIPGKHSMKKDDYLTTTIQAPPKQRIAIVEFDARTQREAFTWNTGTLVLESAQAREDRRKRKELKRLARAQAQGVVSGAMPTTPAVAPPPQPAPPTTTTPSAQQPPGALPPKPRNPAVTIPPPTSHRSGTTPTPTSATPRSTAPTTTPTPWTATSAVRGKKRELEDGAAQPVTATADLTSPSAPLGVVGARPGNGTVRPRPIKKQRTDIQGHARELLVQQPTPQPT